MRSLSVQQVSFVAFALPQPVRLIRSWAFQSSQRRSRSSEPDGWRSYANSAHRQQTEAQLALWSLTSHTPWRRNCTPEIINSNLHSRTDRLVGTDVRFFSNRPANRQINSAIRQCNFSIGSISDSRVSLRRDSHVHNSPRHSAANPPPAPSTRAEIKGTPGNLVPDTSSR
jgi:hypothetical protein